MKALTLVMSLMTIFSFSQSHKIQTGFYETKEDFLNGKVNNVGTYKKWESGLTGGYSVIFVKNGKEVKYKLKDSPYWGFRSDVGVFWRIIDGAPYGIVQMGKIVIYAQQVIAWKTKTGSIETTYDLHGVYFSKGLDGNLLIGSASKSIKQIEESFREDDTELANKTHELTFIDFEPDMKKLIEYITTYNKNHQQ